MEMPKMQRFIELQLKSRNEEGEGGLYQRFNTILLVCLAKIHYKIMTA
jgi:hypothetical protein